MTCSANTDCTLIAAVYDKVEGTIRPTAAEDIPLSINQMYFYSASLLGTAKFKGAYKSVNPIH